MGATCCRSYKDPTTSNETKVTDSIHTNGAPQSLQETNSVSSMSPATSLNNDRYNPENGKTSTINGKTSTTNANDLETRQRLIQFYKTHNPSKLNDQAAINEVLRRYKGRETKLFSDLDRKYVQSKQNDNDDNNQTTNNNNNDTDNNNNNNNQQQNGDGRKQETINKKEEQQEANDIGDDDENSPLNTQTKTKKVMVEPLSSTVINENINNNNKKQKTPISPHSISNRKITKQLLASESPPESEGDDEEDEMIEIAQHPILANHNESESIPINGGNKNKNKTPTSELKVEINPPPINDKNNKKSTPKNDKASKLAEVQFPPSLNSADSFKIEVTKPTKKTFKKKPIGTNLFGQQIGKSLRNRDLPNGKPSFGTKSSNSFSNSRSTSFIQGGTLHTPTSFGDDLPKFGNNIKRSNTLTLDSTHKDKLDKRRQSSLLVRRNQNRRNLPIRINKIWAIFAQYIIDKMLEEKQAERDAKEEKERENNKDKKKNKSKKKKNSLMDIDEEDVELTPEPQEFNHDKSSTPIEEINGKTDDILDSIINSNKDDKNNKKRPSQDDVDQLLFDEDDNNDNNNNNNNHNKGHESIEVLAIDPRLFNDAKTKRRSHSSSSRSSQSSSNSDSNSDGSNNSDGGINIDVYELEITYPQFNIVLNNNNIEVSPDMAAALIWLLLDTNKELDDEVKSLGQESDNLHNNPMKERGFHSKQFKKIYKCKIRYKMIDTLMKRLNNGSVSRQDKSLHPKHLSYEKRNLVIWDKIFEHLLNKTSFNVEEDYLYGALAEEDLTDGDKIIDMLSSLESHWQHRVQLMEHIDDKLNSGSAMERDIFFASILSNNENFIKVLTGWSTQLTDDRSGVARTGVMLLPAVLSSILLCIQYPAILFDEQQVIHPIYNGIFTLVKNRRLKDMADDAYESLIQVTDIFAEVASDLQDFQLLSIIIKVLEDHSNPKIEKHDKARESCIGGIGFLLYGVEPPPEQQINDNNNNIKNNSMLIPNNPTHQAVSTPIGALSEKDRINGTDDIKLPEFKGVGLLKSNSAEKTGTKLSKTMQREYLLENEDFIKSFGNILKNGVTDKSESGRRKAFKLLQRLESEKEGKLLEELQTKWDFTIQKKYKNWKKLSSKPKRKKGKKKSSKKIRGKKSTLKNQVKNMKKNSTLKKKTEKKTEKKSKSDNNEDDIKSPPSTTKITITSENGDQNQVDANYAD